MDGFRESIDDGMTVLPDDGGIPVTKFRAMCDEGHLGMGAGHRRSAGGELGTLFRAQTEQAATYSWMS